ncbi:DUF2271 domain-containing protein [Deinococcus altitudinis]|uniref:DUF2271 domain-containing protein n=1 Tax=Deinococcus altitudinis TaxID=468914 RepID=UPI003892353A
MRHTIKNGIVTRRHFLVHSAVATLSLALGSRLGLAAAGTSKAAWTTANELAISFTTFSSSTFGRVQRPYVVVWIEDASGTPVRTVSLWMLNPPRGTRYLDELRRWYSAASTDNALLPTTTSPTPVAGSYTVVWDGKNDKGASVSQGDYFVCVESAREHGAYSLVRQRITVGAVPFKKSLGANAELKDVAVELRKRA